MNKDSMKEAIDAELGMIMLSADMKSIIRERVKRKKPHRPVKYIAACAAVVLLGSTTVAAGYFIVNRVHVNEMTLPELDPMKVVKINKIDGDTDEYGRVERGFEDYAALKGELGISLLDSELSADNPYMQVRISTDKKDYLMCAIDNYILGDTSDYQYFSEEGRYLFEHGEEYYSPISLSIDIMLSENQLSNGWDADYLGMYEFVENYTSTQGYKVNLVQSTTGGNAVENHVARKCVILVANGIRYTLTGQVSLDKMKAIVDTLVLE